MFSKPEQLEPGENLAGFHSGDPIVDGWANDHAARAKARGTAVVYVVRDQTGFHALSSHRIVRTRPSPEGGFEETFPKRYLSFC